MTGEPVEGFVSPEVAAELPGLRLRWTSLALAPGGWLGRRSSPPELRRRLRELAGRYRGGGVVAMRTQAIPHAYRAFFRQIGLDPDVQRVPVERLAVERLRRGELPSVDLVTDACRVALVETGVPVWALDADEIDAAGLGIATDGAGHLVVCDGHRTHAVAFEDPLPGSAVTAATRRATLFALGVAGIPDIHLEEALWLAAQPLRAPEAGC